MPFQLTKAGVSTKQAWWGVDEKGQFGADVLVFLLFTSFEWGSDWFRC